MPTRHVFGYSKSTRAKCHAPSSCRDTSMPPGTLRYGETKSNEFGETVEWRHWGCVTPDILSRLASTSLDSINGFESLRPSDQQKIRLAMSLRRVDPVDIPASAKPKLPALPASSTTTFEGPSQNKRTAAQAGFDPPTQLSQSQSFLPATQEVEETDLFEEEICDELYCTLLTNVVGIQYYRGMVGPGEEVLLVREPTNPYDRNAVQVKNISRVQVGHLSRNVVGKLASLLDRKAVTVEGIINDGNLSGAKVYSLSISLKIYGPFNQRSQLEPQLIWATPGQRGFAQRNPPSRASTSAITSNSTAKVLASRALPAASQQPGASKRTAAQTEAIRKQQEALRKAGELQRMLSSLEKVDDEGRRSSLLDSLCSSEDILNLPLYPDPPSISNGQLTVELLKHQLQALQWCIDRENPKLPTKETDKPVQFWQLRKAGSKVYYFNLATKTPQETPPALGKGALCADAMGLGKTLTMIALVLATKPSVDPGFSNSTLIVVPLSVLSNWEKQIQDHCAKGMLSYCIYYGTNKGLSARELQNYDVVITTYQTVAGEHDDGTADADKVSKKKKRTERALFGVEWKRIILDEGHNIRNPKTKMARSVAALSGSRRWVLSGTPIINSPRDLGSILTFLRICKPLDNEEFYKRLLLRPLKNGETSGAELLSALMTHICIRRTKEMQDRNGVPIIFLPPVEMIRVPVTLNEEARKLYDDVEQVSKQKLEHFIQGGITASVQSNVLSMLTRMRQIALHPGLLPANYLEELQGVETNISLTGKPISITPAEKHELQYRLAQALEDCEECPICFGVLPNDSRITSCAHIFCLACITEMLARDQKCPMDRRLLTLADLHEPPPPTDLTQRPPKTMDRDEFQGLGASSSAKIEQLIHLLKLTPSNEKSLVFSQFTTFLDKIAEALEEEGIPFVRFDGKMSAKRRQEAISQFSVPLKTEYLSAEMTIQRTRRNGATNNHHQDDNPEGDSESDFVMEDEEDDEEHIVATKPCKKGKGKANVAPFSGRNPCVMLLSLKAGALGLNLTVANNVYLMDPWWQEGIESQAVDRVNRIGQKKTVHVYQLIAENTVESKVLDIQERKKQLIQHAFSGIKRTETQRQQREARLQDLVELFGIRRKASNES